MEEKDNQLTYKDLKEIGMFYAFAGSCISADNEPTRESYDARIVQLEQMLGTIPADQVRDIERVKNGIDLLKRERNEIL